ncbi:hypothetical protein [Acetobacter pasteurianus]|uniref:hypothetical protein n=1 Tax=Acetobacter pasteurianus TaxID=438 RepID=UPI0011DC9CCB|nr:hypothetical protein [Acetobacter pasteurianus]
MEKINTKKLFLISVVTGGVGLFSTISHAQQYVHGHYRSNGTYVQGYERSGRNNTVTDNYSYSGNTNPYTGQTGRNHYQHDTTSPYYTGPDMYGRSGHSSNYSSYGNQDSSSGYQSYSKPPRF